MPVRNTAVRRIAARVMVPVVLATSAIALAPGSGSASTAAAAYGEVINQTDKGMEYASFGGGGRIHRCDVWNDTWNARSADFNNLKCKQVALKPGKKAGGPKNDVDGFTFERHSYHLHIQYVPGGSFHYMGLREKGVWTKITDIDDAVCKGTATRPICHVTIG